MSWRRSRSWRMSLQAGRSRRLSPSAPYNRRDAALRCAGERRGHRRQEPGARRWPRLGLSVALRGAPLPGGAGEDVRAYALNAALGRAAARPQGLGRAAPTTPDAGPRHASCTAMRRGAALEFSAWEQRVGELAVITDAAALERELDAALRFAPHVTRVDADVRRDAGRALRRPRPRPALHGARRRLRAQSTTARRRSPRGWSRRGRIGHVARQWFRSPDVLALLPFDRPEPERSYALVWSLPTERAEALLAIEPAGVRSASSRCHRRRGRRAAPRLRARRLAARRRRRGRPGAARAGCWSATPRTSFIRSPARVSISASPTSPR